MAIEQHFDDFDDEESATGPRGTKKIPGTPLSVICRSLKSAAKAQCVRAVTRCFKEEGRSFLVLAGLATKCHKKYE